MKKISHLSWTLLAVSTLLLLIGLQCGARHQPVPVLKVPGKFAVVRFGHWLKDKNVHMSDPNRYEVRRLSADELLFTVKELAYGDDSQKEWTESNQGVFSKNYYAVNINDQFQSRTATEQEWKQASPILHSRHQVLSINDAASSKTDRQPEEGLAFRGKLFTRSGQSWGHPVALVSPKGKWLAVFSYTSKEPPPQENALFGGKVEAGNGDLFLDVYDIASGEKVITGHAPFTNNAPSMRFVNALWIEDQYLVMPLDISTETCLIANTPVN